MMSIDYTDDGGASYAAQVQKVGSGTRSAERKMNSESQGAGAGVGTEGMCSR